MPHGRVAKAKKPKQNSRQIRANSEKILAALDAEVDQIHRLAAVAPRLQNAEARQVSFFVKQHRSRLTISA